MYISVLHSIYLKINIQQNTWSVVLFFSQTEQPGVGMNAAFSNSIVLFEYGHCNFTDV